MDGIIIEREFKYSKKSVSNLWLAHRTFGVKCPIVELCIQHCLLLLKQLIFIEKLRSFLLSVEPKLPPVWLQNLILNFSLIYFTSALFTQWAG
jgi:hypothetical protein